MRERERETMIDRERRKDLYRERENQRDRDGDNVLMHLVTFLSPPPDWALLQSVY